MSIWCGIHFIMCGFVSEWYESVQNLYCVYDPFNRMYIVWILEHFWGKFNEVDLWIHTHKHIHSMVDWFMLSVNSICDCLHCRSYSLCYSNEFSDGNWLNVIDFSEFWVVWKWIFGSKLQIFRNRIKSNTIRMKSIWNFFKSERSNPYFNVAFNIDEFY